MEERWGYNITNVNPINVFNSKFSSQTNPKQTKLEMIKDMQP